MCATNLAAAPQRKDEAMKDVINVTSNFTVNSVPHTLHWAVETTSTPVATNNASYYVLQAYPKAQNITMTNVASKMIEQDDLI